MTSDSADVHAIVNNKTAQRYQGEDIDAMRAVAKAHHERSLQAFATATTDYKCGPLRHITGRLHPASLTLRRRIAEPN